MKNESHLVLFVITSLKINRLICAFIRYFWVQSRYRNLFLGLETNLNANLRRKKCSEIFYTHNCDRSHVHASLRQFFFVHSVTWIHPISVAIKTWCSDLKRYSDRMKFKWNKNRKQQVDRKVFNEVHSGVEHSLVITKRYRFNRKSIWLPLKVMVFSTPNSFGTFQIQYILRWNCDQSIRKSSLFFHNAMLSPWVLTTRCHFSISQIQKQEFERVILSAFGNNKKTQLMQ